MAKKKKKKEKDERSPYELMANRIEDAEMTSSRKLKSLLRVRPQLRHAYQAGKTDVRRLIYLGLSAHFIRIIGDSANLCHKNKYESDEVFGMYCEGWSRELSDAEMTAVIDQIEEAERHRRD